MPRYRKFKNWLNLRQAKRIIMVLVWIVFVQAFIIGVFINKQKQAKGYVKPHAVSVVREPVARQAVVAVTPAVPVPPVSIPAAKLPVVKFPSRKGVKIAIVIDDWGYNLDNLSCFDEIKESFTVAVLPHLSYSSKIANYARSRRKEIILHIPMEPKNENVPLEKNTIMTGMPEAEVKSIIDNALSGIAGVKGVNNHMGSKATEDRELMEVVFNYLKKKKLYFLDSWTGRSICKALASKVGIGFARRDVFLDNQEDPYYIREQFKQLINEAKINGSAIGICHDRKNSLLVFKEMIPEIKKNDIELVFVSELIRRD